MMRSYRILCSLHDMSILIDSTLTEKYSNFLKAYRTFSQVYCSGYYIG